MSSRTSQLMARDGLGLLVRHWDCSTPRAHVLIVHGVGEHSGRWERVGDYLTRHGFSVTSYDQRGHGASGGERCDVDDFAEFLDDLELVLGSVEGGHEPTIVYGHSMGGLIATSYGVSNRPQPDLYVLSAPALSANIPIALRAAIKGLGRLRPGLRLANSIKGEQLSSDPRVGEAYFNDPLVQTKATVRFGNAFLREMDSIRDRYSQLTRPALVIHGADDELVPPQASAPLAELDSVSRKLFARLRHEIHNETNWEEVLDYVIGWVETQLS